MANREAIMRRIRAMLDRADHPNTPPEEAATARAMVEKMMLKHRIEEEEALQRGDVKAADALTVQDVFMDVCPWDSKYADTYLSIFGSVIFHVGARAVLHGTRVSEDGTRIKQCRVFGYESDLAFAEMLFTSARLYFAARMEPRPDPTASDADNVYVMRSAGMERIRIAEVMGWGTTGSATAKVTRLYKRACEDRSEEPLLTGRGNSVVDYRTEYANSFRDELSMRLFTARNGVDADGAGIVLHNRLERVEEVLYEAYPYLRPQANATEHKHRKATRAPRWTAADQKRWERRQSAAGQAGRSSGRAAAQDVHIDGTTPKRRLSN